MLNFDLVVIGGGAAGFMTAITARERGVRKIKILEGSSRILEKVRISGGGRCNVTNATWIPADFVENYPRGGIKLLESLSRFASGDIFDWFEKRGVKLKIEDDNRVFPISDSSMDIVNCLQRSAEEMDIQISKKKFVRKIIKVSSDLFKVYISDNEYFFSKKILISTGGHPTGYKLASALGHQIIKPIPSLFSFTCKENFLKECSGVSVRNLDFKILINGNSFSSKGDLLITHWGFSGPGILKLSSIAAREIYDIRYKFKLNIQWSRLSYTELNEKLNQLRQFNGKSNLYNTRPLSYLTKRLWIFLLNKMKINKDKKWADIVTAEKEIIIKSLMNDEYQITNKGPFADEFVTSGGVDLNEVSFKTMESFICKGLYLSGEVLDVDGITGGFNFQHCWTSGWLAGVAIANSLK